MVSLNNSGICNRLLIKACSCFFAFSLASFSNWIKLAGNISLIVFPPVANLSAIFSSTRHFKKDCQRCVSSALDWAKFVKGQVILSGLEKSKGLANRICRMLSVRFKLVLYSSVERAKKMAPAASGTFLKSSSSSFVLKGSNAFISTWVKNNFSSSSFSIHLLYQ